MIQKIDRVAGLLPTMGAQMGRMVCSPVLALYDIKRTVRHISWIPLPERAATPKKRSIRVDLLAPVLLGQSIAGSVRPVPGVPFGEGAAAPTACIVCHVVETGTGCGHRVGSRKNGSLVPLGLRRSRSVD